MGNANCLAGIGVNTGIAIGEIYIFDAYRPQITHNTGADFKEETARYIQAKAEAEKELRAIADKLQSGGSDKAAIFTAHIDILTDEEIDMQIQAGIQDSHYSAEYAIHSTYSAFAEILAQMDDPVIRERSADMTDVSLRLLRILEGREEKSLLSLPGPVIVAAQDLLPSNTVNLDRQNVLGILTEAGNSTSHTAILAKNSGIPAILGISGLMGAVREGQRAAMDAGEGRVILDPDRAEISGYEEKQRVLERESLIEQSYVGRELYTRDGVRVSIFANIGAPGPDIQTDAQGTDGVGLFRTEFLYMENGHLPTEEEQFQAYCAVLRAYAGKPVTLRTVDIGGDKSIPYLPLPKEDNPFLGVRALRLCYEHQYLFRTQLRAALRASAFGTLQLMFPMVASLDDIRWAKSMVEAVGRELDQEEAAWDHDLKIGIMMEIPSIMLISDLVAGEVDFASVGTNDLCQYLTASDRLNPGTSRYYQNFHPAMFRLIGYAAKEFASRGKPLGVCGEMGGDPLAAPVLLGLGVRRLSMSRTCVGKIKYEVSGFRMDGMERLAEEVLACRTEEEAKQKASRFRAENRR